MPLHVCAGILSDRICDVILPTKANTSPIFNETVAACLQLVDNKCLLDQHLRERDAAHVHSRDRRDTVSGETIQKNTDRLDEVWRALRDPEFCDRRSGGDKSWSADEDEALINALLDCEAETRSGTYRSLNSVTIHVRLNRGTRSCENRRTDLIRFLTLNFAEP